MVLIPGTRQLHVLLTIVMSFADLPGRPFGLQWFPPWSPVLWSSAEWSHYSVSQIKGRSLVNHLPSDQMGNPAMIHRNEWHWETDFLKELSPMCHHPPTHSLTHSLTYSNGEIKIKQIVELNERARESFTEPTWKISIQVLSTDHLFPMCVIAQWIFTSLIPEALWGRGLCMSLQGPANGNCVLWYSLLQADLFLFPLHNCFPLWHVVFICWTQESVNLGVICLSCSARVMFFKPGSGNFFQCVIEGYDNYPFSISTVDMFIVLNVHLLISLLFCIMEIFSIYFLWLAL